MRAGSALVLTLAAVTLLAASDSDAAPKPGFRMFDSMLFDNRPDFGQYGFEHLRIVDSHTLWPRGDDRNAIPDARHIHDSMHDADDPTGIVVIDIEAWPEKQGDASEQDSIRKYLEALRRFRAENPNLKYGYYDTVPSREVHPALAGPGSGAFAEWQHRNDVIQPLADKVDVLFPAVYTMVNNEADWKVFAERNLAEAHRIARGKPIYCFLWPQRHPGAVNGNAQPYALLDAHFWRLELDTCYQHADGIVVWGGYDMPGNRYEALPWDDNAPWWRATLSFMKDNGLLHPKG